MIRNTSHARREAAATKTRIKQGWAALRDNRRGGVALIAALCAAAVLLGLAASLLYSSSLVLARSNRKIGRERTYELAKSFDAVLESELTSYNTDKKGVQLGASNAKQSPEDEMSFYDFVNQFLDRDVYSAYDPDNANSTYYYSLSGDGDENYGKPRIRLRKSEPAERATPTNGSFSIKGNAEGGSTVEALESARYIRYTVEVCSEVDTDDGTYAYTTEFYRYDQYQPAYTWQGDWDSKDEAVRVYWVNNGWYLDKNGGTPKELRVNSWVDEEGNTQTETEPGATISYEFDLENDVTYRTYVPTAESGETPGGADPDGSGSGGGETG